MSTKHEMFIDMMSLGRLQFIQERGVIGTLFENLRNCAIAVVVENKMLSTINLDQLHRLCFV